MKKWLALALVVLLGLTLCACARENTGVHTGFLHGKAYTIDYDAHTITCGETTCTFKGSKDHITLTWPDGVRVELNGSTTTSTGGHWEESLEFFAILQMNLPERAPWWVVPIAVVIIAVGVVYIAFPEKFWRLQHLLTVEGGEPTDFALSMNRGCGVFLVVIGAIFLLLFVLGY